MKKFKFLFVGLLAVLFLSACATPELTSSAVQIPNEVKVALNAVILLGVMYGLQLIFDWAGIDLRGIGVTIATAVTEFAVLQLQGWIDVVPAAYDPFITVGLQILLAVLVFLGGVRLFAQHDRAKMLLAPRKK